LWIPSIQFGALTFLAQGIALIFDTTSLVIISRVIASILFWKKYKAQGLLLLGAMGGDALLISVLKTLDHVVGQRMEFLWVLVILIRADTAQAA
jgi:hypothetical protein